MGKREWDPGENGFSKCGTITTDCDESHRTQMPSKMWHNFCWLWKVTWFKLLPAQLLLTDKSHRTQMASQNVAQLLLTVLNCTKLQWCLNMWHNYCCQWWITHHTYETVNIWIKQSCMKEYVWQQPHNNICRFIYLWLICNSCLIVWNTPVIT